VKDLNLSAAILVGPAPTEAVAALRRPNLPLVLVDNTLTDHTGHAVMSDNFGGTRAAVEHLVALGHRQIAFVGGPMQPGRPGTNAIHSIWWRALGYRTALEEHGIAVRPELLENCDLTVAGGAEAAKRLLDGPPLTAVVAANDPTAVGVLQMFKERGVAVPGDISVVGYDDDPSYHVTPRLTTVHVDTHGMGAAAVRLLADGFNGSTPAPMVCTLPVQLVVRASSGPVKDFTKIPASRPRKKLPNGGKQQ
jgi:LacI family transcriptional regulator